MQNTGLIKLRHYLNDLKAKDRELFARHCGTTVGYLRKAISKGQKLGESLCINIERESKRKLLCEEMRPDVNWAFIRGTSKSRVAATAARRCNGCTPGP